MTITTMRERVARAAMDSIRQQFGAPPLGLHGQETAWTAPGGTIDLYAVADAVFDALETPSEAMVEAGVQVVRLIRSIRGHPDQLSATAAATFTAMIREAKKQ